ncbi:type II secretion system F family protein [Thermopetrobacter sp. TC1]|uniref:type II secretion system F family protein n=1 Tax=Thermopetrobacter sp. TC1 TaxID=1495045 RepID=UPI000571FB8B|nr:type II secretion system F family protein [Thermopetrobacter sp. TC1]
MNPQFLQIVMMGVIALVVGGLTIFILQRFMSDKASRSRRMNRIVNEKEVQKANLQKLHKDKRRKQVQAMLREVEEETRRRKKGQRPSLKKMLRQAGLKVSPVQYYLFALGSGVILGLVTLVLSRNPFVGLGGLLVGGLGVPYWLLKFLRKRRELAFLTLLPETIDAMVRSIKAGLPLNEALKLVAKEMPDPIGVEFREVVEGQRLGIPLDQGFQRMYDRMPLPEVNFLSIVIGIQQQSGGNLSEVLNNLAKVLRDRKGMRLKVKALSQEAKAGASIIGALPVLLLAAISVLNPEYIQPLFNTITGKFMLVGAVVWMSTGIIVMYKMINFKV